MGALDGSGAGGPGRLPTPGLVEAVFGDGFGLGADGSGNEPHHRRPLLTSADSLGTQHVQRSQATFELG